MLQGIYRMTPRQFRKAIDAGAFGENRVELLGGVPFVMSENPPHIVATSCVLDQLRAVAPPPRWFANKEHSLALGQWRPLADGIILRGPRSTYSTRLARGRDVALLAEVSDTTYARDSGPKLRRYATHRIPVYWIVDLARRMVDVHTRPFGEGKQARYARRETYRECAPIPVELDGQEVGRVAVSELLP
jgi:Uma2 family endonuclease